MNIYVSNLSFSLQSENLRELFAPYGEVTSASIISDKATGRSRGFGFVEMEDEAAKAAIAALDGTSVGDRVIKVNEAKPREQSSTRRSDPFRSGGNGGSNSGGGFNNRRSYNENQY